MPPSERIVFLDTETTGLSPESGDRIVEIGCVEMTGRRRTGNDLHFYVNPQRLNAVDALAVHSLTDAFLVDKPLFATIADQLLKYLEGAEVVIHNAPFDVGFLDAELARLRRRAFGAHVAKVCDSLALARDLFPGKPNSLDALCRRFEIDNSARTVHGALLDAGLLAEAYIHMTRGQADLGMSRDEGFQLEVAGELDLSKYKLQIIQATPEEIALHDLMMAEIAPKKPAADSSPRPKG